MSMVYGYLSLYSAIAMHGEKISAVSLFVEVHPLLHPHALSSVLPSHSGYLSLQYNRNAWH